MKYKVTKVDIKQTKEGKDFKRADLVDSVGQAFLGVPYWNSMPEYESIAVGSVIEGTLTSTQNGAYMNHKLSLANAPKSGFGGGVAKAQEVKAQTIEKAQDRKNSAIQSAQDRNEVMYAKNNAAMIIAHHPAYADLNNLNLTAVFQNLARVFYDYDPSASTMNAYQRDDIQSIREVARVEHITPDDEINPDNIPF